MSQSYAKRIEAANTALIRDGNLDEVSAFFAPDYVVHFNGKTFRQGHDIIHRAAGMLAAAFPELEVDIQVLVESEERIAWQRTLTGIQKGAYQGFPATQQRVVWRDMVTTQFRDGLIVEDWVVSDLAEQLLRTRKR